MTMRIIYLTLLLAAACAASMRAQAPAWADAWSYPMVGTEQPVGAGIDATGNIYVAVHARDFTVEDPARAITAAFGREVQAQILNGNARAVYRL